MTKKSSFLYVSLLTCILSLNCYANELECMASNVYNEARGDGIESMRAVAQVTMNRVKSNKFPDNVCEVVWQEKQFSWTNNITVPCEDSWGYMKAIESNMGQNGPICGLQAIIAAKTYPNSHDLGSWNLATNVASAAINNALQADIDNALYYHSIETQVSWTSNLKKIGRINNHIFWRE